MTNAAFGRLLRGAIGSIAAYEGKTAHAVERDLGEEVGLAGASIQRYKSGHLPPELRTIEIFAEAGVKRGYLNREWLQKFLTAANHPAAEKILARLYPVIAATRLEHSRTNLPRPTYNQFVMRRVPYDEVLEGLRQRSAVVLIASLGGMGKTSLALEVAIRSLKEEIEEIRFDAAVWVSDKDNPGVTHLDSVLDEIVRVLDYPGLTSLPHAEKAHEIDQLLRRLRVLIIIDNFETITDRALLDWLLRLPEPSKAIVTTREYRREFRRNCWPIELHGMHETEAREFIQQRLRVLKMESSVTDLEPFRPLLAATSGNPKAIELALGYIKYQNRPLQEVIDNLYAARGDLFKDLFERSWSLLNESTKRVLLATTLFPTSVNREGLASTADVEGFAFDSALEQLSDLALVDVQRMDMNTAARYTLHSLVRAFAQSKVGDYTEFEKTARHRWLKWCNLLTSKVGYCWNDLKRLEWLDLELDTVHMALEWSYQNHLYGENLQIALNCSYYYYVRGFWTKQPSMHLMAAESAHQIGDVSSEAMFYTFYSHILSKQGNPVEAKKYNQRLQELAQSKDIPNSILQDIQHAIALAHFAANELEQARDVWQASLALSQQVSRNAYIINREWLAVCLYLLGNPIEARSALAAVRQEAQQIDSPRAIIFTQMWLAKIDLDEKQLDDTEQLLKSCTILAEKYQDRESISDISRLYVQLYELRGNFAAAKESLAKAIDLYERLGFRNKLAQAREEFSQLESASNG